MDKIYTLQEATTTKETTQGINDEMTKPHSGATKSKH